jgi:16S rRNA (uracil1498-N3)-methyltransferase
VLIVHRFYVTPANIDIANRIATVRKEELHHLAGVLRLKSGDDVVIFDGAGWEYQGLIKSITKAEAIIIINASHFFARESELEVWLIQGIAKGDKMEFIIQKAVELGVRGIIPLEAKRSVVKLFGSKKTEREKRWQKAAVEAAKQSRRTLVPIVKPAQGLQQILCELPPQRHLLVPWEEGGASLREVLRQQVAPLDEALPGETLPGEAVPIYILIGPEGGLTSVEVDLTREFGGIPVTLGPRILRTETAGLAAIAAVMYERGDWGK